MTTIRPTTVSAVDLEPTQNLNVVATRPIVTPRQLEEELPESDKTHATVVEARQAIRGILRGEDKRLLAVVGPCSVHDPAAAYEYAQKLAVIHEQVKDQIYVVMRVYFEKPRTTVGWKGLINDPHLNGTFDMNTGLRLARKLLLDINTLGLPCATELLDPIVPQYIDDLVSWVAIGARTTESQTHRQMASGLSMPVGFKNSTDGSVQIAIDAMKAARSGHHFLGIDENGAMCIVQTRGNTDGHIILRGGSGKTNYEPASVAEAASLLQKAGLNPVLMVDCSHANSSKRHENQCVVWDSLIQQRHAHRDQSSIVGVMIESNLNEGRQDVGADLSQLKYGVSITDACINWADTERLLISGHAALGA
ncbi:MAG: 3-deoxy-7-phosphoheptulonate synthase [Burkholderiales bacterium]|nr:3-deoxy-7-phosphoheptulonate synthase [Phycisphaerae bacterium]